MQGDVVSGINFGFPKLSQSEGQITHVLLTRSPLEYPRKGLSARLACVKHAASVRPEPGSNSPLKNKKKNPWPNKIKPQQATITEVTAPRLPGNVETNKNSKNLVQHSNKAHY